jgi:hypothetical protein
MNGTTDRESSKSKRFYSDIDHPETRENLISRHSSCRTRQLKSESTRDELNLILARKLFPRGKVTPASGERHCKNSVSHIVMGS